MILINDATVAIDNSEELKNILESNNNINYIYLNQDITLTSGITINSNKNSITIDGTYNDIKHTLTDMKSSGASSTISVRYSTILRVVIKNIDLVGYNYYGIIYCLENASLASVIVEYNNVLYNGPQLSFHPMGLTRIIDSTINIITAYNQANEVAECNRIEIGGNTTITTSATANSTFWFRGTNNPYLYILENANVSINIINRELFYGVNNLEFIINKNATLNLETCLGMGYGTYATKNTQILSGATLYIHQTKRNGTYPTWYIT